MVRQNRKAQVAVDTEPRDRFGIAGAARLLNRKASWIYRACDCGVLPHFRVGKYIVFDRSELETWLSAQRRGPRVQSPAPEAASEARA